METDTNIFHNIDPLYHDNCVVISDDGTRLSFSNLLKLSDSFSGKLPERSLVLSFNKNTIGSLVGYFSFIRNRYVPLMIENTLHKSFISHFVETYKINYLWLPSEKLSEWPDAKVLHEMFDYTLIKLTEIEKIPVHEELGLLLSTSGSTGSPKLVRISYKNIYANAISISKYLSINWRERPITTLPMSYSFGISILNSHLINGAKILLTDRSLVEKSFWDFLKEHQATSLSGVPYSFEILKRLRFFNMDLPSLRTITQAGGKLNEKLNKEFSEFCMRTGKRFFVMYGQTEATARMSYLPPEQSLNKLGSMGIAIPNGEFSLIDEEGKIIDNAESVGELVYKGDNVSLGYADCVEDLIKGDENNGVLITGDMAKRDSDGFYYVVGRKKRFIKIYGNRVNLDETERLLKNIISQCACTGTDDKMEIFITDATRKDEIRDYIVQVTGINHRAFKVHFINEIPKNAAGKTLYSKLETL